ncbi:MAG: T9SS type A sorting domain-containing protein, partial [bacterium]
AGTQHFHPCWEGQQPFFPMTIFVIEAKYNGQHLTPNDEIGIFDGGLCVGAGVVTGTISSTNFLEIINSRDDGISGLGFKEGNKILFKIWIASTNQEFLIDNGGVEFHDIQTGDPINPIPFTGLGTAVVSISGKPPVENILWIDTTLTANKNDIIKIPVNSSDLTGGSVYSAGITITFDPTVMEAIDTDITETILAASGWDSPTKNITAGQIKLGMAGSFPLTGSGILIKIVAHVIGNEGDSTILHFHEATLQEEDYIVSTSDGLLKVTGGFDIKGQLQYYNNPTIAVNDATVQLSGDAAQSYISDATGNYEFLDLSSGDYQVKPEKMNDDKNAISPLDASMVLRYEVNLITLTPYQKIAGDVSGNGTVTSFDASWILRYYVNLVSSFPIGSDWTFVPHDFLIDDTNWSTSPRSRSYTPLQSDQLDQNFMSILYGDVSGNWTGTGGSGSSIAVDIEIGDIQQTGQENWQISLKMQFSDVAYSGSFKILFDKTNLQFESASTVNVTTDVISEAASYEGGVNFAFASGQLLNNQDLQINLIFKGLTSIIPSPSDFSITDLIIDDNTAIITSIKNQSENEIPAHWHLSQNRPNPFNAETYINYQVPKSSHIKIEVLNLLGQRLYTLVNEEKVPGIYKAIWNGTDDKDLSVGSGIYIYRMEAGEFTAIKKMVLVQ